MRNNFLLAIAITVIAFPSKAFAQGPNNFFGSALPSSAPSASNPPSTNDGGDYTDDEKRMQKKLKANIQRAKDLMSKGQSMMKKGEAKHDDKLFKKGKIIKEIGEKQLSELKSNDPFMDNKTFSDK